MRQPGAMAQGSVDGRIAACVCWRLGPAGQGGDGDFYHSPGARVRVLGGSSGCDKQDTEFPEQAGIHCLCLAGKWS